MSVAAEMTRLKRDLDSLEEEVAVNSGPKAKAPLTDSQRRTLKANIQGLIQKLDELAGKLS